MIYGLDADASISRAVWELDQPFPVAYQRGADVLPAFRVVIQSKRAVQSANTGKGDRLAAEHMLRLPLDSDVLPIVGDWFTWGGFKWTVLTDGWPTGNYLVAPLGRTKAVA